MPAQVMPIVRADPLPPASTFYSRMAANVRQLREAQDITRSWIARRAGLPESTWRHFEQQRGQGGIRVYAAWCVAEALGVSLDTLCTASGVAPPMALTDPLRAPRIHQLLQAVATLPDDAQELLVSTALELQMLLRRHGRLDA